MFVNTHFELQTIDYRFLTNCYMLALSPKKPNRQFVRKDFFLPRDTYLIMSIVSFWWCINGLVNKINMTYESSSSFYAFGVFILDILISWINN